MATDFFEQQASARRRTQWLRLAFALAVLLVALVVTLIVLVTLGRSPHPGMASMLAVFTHAPDLAWKTASIVVVVIAVTSGLKAWSLRGGGDAVARSLGGLRVSPQTDNPRLKQLLNVVEEMAIAARIPAPAVYVLPAEDRINAFAAGRTPQAAAIGLTRGALDQFNRAELQAVVGHEFSHILNGDMALNTRLIAWLSGLYVFTDIARFVVTRKTRKGKNTFDARAFLIWPLLLGLYLAGSIGTFVGRLLQAAISRRREQLADASAVQFTRDPEALKSVLLKIAAVQGGSDLRAPAAADAAHLFFAGTQIGWISRFNVAWLSTHPPLEERMRALDANLTKEKILAMVGEQKRERRQRAAAAPAPAPFMIDQRQDETPAVAAALPRAVASLSQAMATVAPATSAPMVDLLFNRLTREQQQAVTAATARVGESATRAQAACVAALLLDHPGREQALIRKLAPLLGAGGDREVADLSGTVRNLEPMVRLPFLLSVLPLVERQDKAARARLLTIARSFARTLRHDAVFGFALTRILQHRLMVAPPAASAPAQLTDLTAEIGVVLSRLALECQNPVLAFRAGIQALMPPPKRPMFAATAADPAKIDHALAQLATLHPSAKRAFVDALARAIAHDRRLTASKADLLRVCCAMIDWPLPSLPLDTVFAA